MINEFVRLNTNEDGYNHKGVTAINTAKNRKKNAHGFVITIQTIAKRTM